jgi:O-antigen ligase
VSNNGCGYRFYQILYSSQTIRFLRFCKQIYAIAMLNQAVIFLHRLMDQSQQWFQLCFAESGLAKIVGLGKRFGISLWEQSYRFGMRRWQPLFEAVTILLVVFMPVLGHWLLLIPLLLLMWLSQSRYTSLLTKELLLFGTVMTVSACLSEGFRAGVPVLITSIEYLIMAYLTGQTFQARFSRKLLLYLSCSSLLWMGIGMLQQWSGIPTPPGWLAPLQRNSISVRSYSLFGNPNIYALYLLSIFVLGSYFIFRTWTGSTEKRKVFTVYRIGWTLLLVMVLFSLYFTYTRSAWLIGLILLVIFVLSSEFKSGQWRWLILLLIPLLLLSIQGFRVRTATLLTMTDSSLWYRIHIWQGVLKCIHQYWLWGSGPGSFLLIYPWHQFKDTFSAHAHQLFLQIWLENGILSMIAYFWLVRKVIKSCRTGKDYLTRIVGLIITIFLIDGMVETWSESSLMNGYFWLFCGLGISLKSGEIKTK